MTETRACAYEECLKGFIPMRPHQRFCSEPCRYAQWKLENERGTASGAGQRVEGGVGSRGGNVRSVTEARELQTASKPLDRWRLIMEVQIHRTLLATGHFHIDDLDCLDLPAEAFKVRGTLVSSVRRSGVMRSTNVYRKVSHKAANGRPAPIYEITPGGREQLSTLAGSGGDSPRVGTSVAAAPSQNQEPSIGLDIRNPEGTAGGDSPAHSPAPSTGRGRFLRDNPHGAGSAANVEPDAEALQLDVPRESGSSAYSTVVEEAA